MEHFIEVLGLPLLACLAMTAMLGYLGIHVLKREIIFIDIALAQIVAVGTVGSQLALGHHHHGHAIGHHLITLALTLAAAAFYAVVRRKVTQIPLEAVIGVSYAIAAAAAMFLVGAVAGAHLHVQQMLGGSVLWVTWADIVACVVVFAVVGVCFYLCRKPFERISDDYDAAVRSGMRVVVWDFVFYTLFGLVIMVAVHVGGVVVVFAFLIIPATISALFSKHLTTRLLITWAAGVLCTLVGLLFADRLDFSVGPSVALFLGLGLVLASITSRFRPAVSWSVSVVAAVCAAGMLFLSSSPAGTSASAAERPHVLAGEQHQEHHHHHGPAPDPPEQTASDKLEDVDSIEQLIALYDKASDPSTRSEIVLRALGLAPKRGAELSLRFLKDDPPFFFRQSVIDKLSQTMAEPLEFDVMQPFADTRNQEAAGRVRSKYGLQDP